MKADGKTTDAELRASPQQPHVASRLPDSFLPSAFICGSTCLDSLRRKYFQLRDLL
jgi:hypothetical protein